MDKQTDQKSCPACGLKNPPGMRFCGHCGTRLEPGAPPAEGLLDLIEIEIEEDVSATHMTLDEIIEIVEAEAETPTADGGEAEETPQEDEGLVEAVKERAKDLAEDVLEELFVGEDEREAQPKGAPEGEVPSISFPACPVCTTKNLPGATHCVVCGAVLGPSGAPCPACGSLAPPGALFCAACGHRLGLEETA